jgi:hypothetical protein
MEFLTGFNTGAVTKPGFVIEHDNFLIAYKGIMNLGIEANIAFESCYDWTQVMNILLQMDQFKHFIRSAVAHSDLDLRYDTFEYFLTLDIARWLTSFHGWGILWNIIRPDYQEYFSDKLSKVNEEMEKDEDYSTSKVFTDVVEIFRKDFEMELDDIMPPINIVINDCEKAPGKFIPREKEILIQFGYQILAVFRIQKKALQEDLTLLNLAAEVVVNNVEDKTDFEQLSIPLCLVEHLEDKLWDVWWGNKAVESKNFEEK